MDHFLSRTSRKYLARCGKRTKAAIVEAIEKLPDNGDIQKLKGRRSKNIFRLRVGGYRVLFIREGDSILILDIDTRGDIYK